MNIAILQYYKDFGNIITNQFTVLSQQICKSYAKLNGYSYLMTSNDYYPNRNCNWNKIKEIKNNLSNYDYILYIDTDAWFVTPGITIENTITEILEIYQANDFGLIIAADTVSEKVIFDRNTGNCGAMIFKNNELGHDILDKWLQYGDDHPFTWNGWPAEQGCFNATLLRTHKGIVFCKEYYLMNGHYGHFIRHLSGMGGETRLKVMQKFIQSHPWTTE